MKRKSTDLPTLVGIAATMTAVATVIVLASYLYGCGDVGLDDSGTIAGAMKSGKGNTDDHPTPPWGKGWTRFCPEVHECPKPDKCPPVPEDLIDVCLDTVDPVERTLIGKIVQVNREVYERHLTDITRLPMPEVCGDFIDNDCDGEADEDCDEIPGPDPECYQSSCSEGTLRACNGGGSCGSRGICAKTPEGGGLCINGDVSCLLLEPCDEDQECADGAACVVDTCCGDGTPLCIPEAEHCSNPV